LLLLLLLGGHHHLRIDVQIDLARAPLAASPIEFSPGPIQANLRHRGNTHMSSTSHALRLLRATDTQRVDTN
jgi:hypothetical protein